MTMRRTFGTTVMWLGVKAIVWLGVKAVVWPTRAVVWLGAQGWHSVEPFMTPRQPPGSARPVERLRLALNSAGVVAAGASFAYWRNLSNFSLSNVLDNWLNGTAQAVIVALIALFLSCLGLLALQRQGGRVALLKTLSLPLRVAVGYCAGVILPVMAVGWATHQHTSPTLLFVLFPAEVFWFGAFLHASILAARHFFRAEEVHPAMGSSCLAFVGIWSLFVSMRSLVQDGLNQAYPSWAAVLLAFAVPAGIVALSGWDLIHLNASGHLRGRMPITLGDPTVETADVP